ncbi:pyridoxal phosphate-dependent aminotransferase [soil metagenome]
MDELSTVNLSKTFTKLPDTGETIFTVMNDLALKNNAINLGQGFPDFDMNPQLKELVNQAMKDGKNQYAHMNGVPVLREAVAAKVASLYQNQINPEKNITVTPGGTYAIYTALTSFLKKGDEVIVFEPAFDSYIPNIIINGATPVTVPLTFPEYKIDWERTRAAISSSTKCIIINSPHNPAGSVIDENDIKNLIDITQGTDILLLSDEVYEHIIFDGLTHHSFLKYPELFERSFVCFSFGKVYNCTGWKLGYCIAPDRLMKEFRNVHQFNCFSCNAPVQHGLAKFLPNKMQYINLGSFMQNKRDYFMELMKATSFKPLSSSGSYFQLYDYSTISDIAEADFAKKICKEARVAAVPVSAFYQDGTNNSVIRFCFAKKEETLLAAVDRLVDFENKML